MEQHGFASVEDFRGASLPYFTTHHELVRLQREAIDAKKRARTGLAGDADWSGDGFVRCAASPVLGFQGFRILTYFTTHHELVRLQREAIDATKRARTGLAGDADWSGDGFVRCDESPVLGYQGFRILTYFTTHHELVRLQREAIDAKKRARTGLAGDADWSGNGFVRCAAFPMLGCRVWRENTHAHWPGWLR